MRLHLPKLDLSLPKPAPCQHQSPAELYYTKGFMKAVRAKFSASVFCQDVWTFAGEATADRCAFVVVCSCTCEYYDAADGTIRSSRPLDLCKMRSEIAAASDDKTRKKIDMFALAVE